MNRIFEYSLRAGNEVCGLKVQKIIGEGYFGSAFLVHDQFGTQMVLKVPKSERFVQQIKKECLVIDTLSKIEGLTEFLPKVTGWYHELPGFAMEYVYGERYGSQSEISAIAEFMRRLHSLDTDMYREKLNLPAPSVPYPRYYLSTFEEAVVFFKDIAQFIYIEDVRFLINDLSQCIDTLERRVVNTSFLLEDINLALIHGDIRPVNLSWENRRLHVFDWGQCRLDDPAVDIAIAFRWFLCGEKEEKDFWEAYQPTDDLLVKRVESYKPTYTFYSLIYLINRLRLWPDPEEHTPENQKAFYQLLTEAKIYWDRQKMQLLGNSVR